MANTNIDITTSTPQTRIESLDQFRGYSVAAMFIVNFVCGLAATHHLLKHNNTHFSYADSIMPSFLFACGFSYRMSYLKRMAKVGHSATARSILRRSLVLIGLSAVVTFFDLDFASWNSITFAAVKKYLIELIKANLWEVLAIIGAVQIGLLPLVWRSSRVRIAAILCLAVLHTFLSWSFNEAFVYGLPNWMDGYFGGTGKRAWDGGLFGLLAWSEIMLAGTLAFDIVEQHTSAVAWRRLLVVGAGMMVVGYALSCMTRLYDRPAVEDPLVQDQANPQAGVEDEIAWANGMAKSPVVPDFSKAAGRSVLSLLAEPPLVPPPGMHSRAINYWRMDKRVVTQSFVLFGSGWAMACFGLFVLICDVKQKRLGLFTTFGQNALAAYIIHHFIAVAFLAVIPKDAAFWLVLSGLGLYFTLTYLLVRMLEIRQLYLRL